MILIEYKEIVLALLWKGAMLMFVAASTGAPTDITTSYRKLKTIMQ